MSILEACTTLGRVYEEEGDVAFWKAAEAPSALRLNGKDAMFQGG
jgi:hypothetical protein